MAEPRPCLELYRRPDKNFLIFVKRKKSLGWDGDLEGTVGVEVVYRLQK